MPARRTWKEGTEVIFTDGPFKGAVGKTHRTALGADDFAVIDLEWGGYKVQAKTPRTDIRRHLGPNHPGRHPEVVKLMQAVFGDEADDRMCDITGLSVSPGFSGGFSTRWQVKGETDGISWEVKQ